MDIPDPYRKPVKEYQAALELIQTGVSEWMEKL
jgi:protein-tyrosine-phosphatase